MGNIVQIFTVLFLGSKIVWQELIPSLKRFFIKGDTVISTVASQQILGLNPASFCFLGKLYYPIN